jgi:hypothetical protein
MSSWLSLCSRKKTSKQNQDLKIDSKLFHQTLDLDKGNKRDTNATWGLDDNVTTLT